MENASKALIIAGAILLAIVIISLGLVVVNNSRSVTENANLSEQEIQSFNAKFIAYEGTNVSGSRVNALIQQVIATNQDLVNQGKATVGGSTNDFVHIVFPSISKETSNNKFIYVTGIKNDSGNDVVAGFTDQNENVNHNDIHNFGGVVSSALSVSTGRNYTVKIKEYKNGLVHIITVKANS